MPPTPDTTLDALTSYSLLLPSTLLDQLGDTTVPALSTSSPAGGYPPVTPPPSKIVTRPILAQMGLIFAEPVAFEALALRKTYPTTEKHETAETLAADLDNDGDLTVVLVAGRCTQSGLRAVSGFHLPWAEMEGAAASCQLFELSPVQDVFRGDLSEVARPGYRLDEQTKQSVFGRQEKACSLCWTRIYRE
ncbi:uncharacterized protein BO66DRAFT_440707 [Aspergillus aculeatinus CBS 121060]|uniref:Uncharacterized protein n=1 Tax=Aspergillus aculeatinus CBS 121060 TaxID=1448322 RepID=A0ACD1H1Z0_9EURO|nr:hypothetical protein BO66DRAFT_440707 [Aspergillus aculeatinus CBS 121060]RAH67772.1 hypothetical protein BO66DRAFT_440707 [Aspergillus aculeatinus CBS 121060]